MQIDGLWNMNVWNEMKQRWNEYEIMENDMKEVKWNGNRK